MTFGRGDKIGRWEINGQEMVDFVANGQPLHVTAVGIWEAEFAPEDSPYPKPSTELPEIMFAPALLSLGFILEQGLGGGIEVKLATRGRPPLLKLNDWPRSDQLLLENQWFALDGTYLASVKQLFEAHGVCLSRPVSHEQLMWLYWSSGLEVEPLVESSSNQLFDVSSHQYEPELVRASLYPYQVQGAQFLCAMSDQGLGVLLADEMGLGKTLQAIYLMSHETARRHELTIVVCPSALITNWQREIARFTPWLTVLVHRSPTRTGDARVFAGFDVVLTSYEVLIRDIGLLESVQWNLVLLDEAQSVKNPDAKRSAAVKRLQRRIGVAITGTPIENSLRDMWSIFEFIAPSYLGSLRQFERSYPDELTAARALSRRAAPMLLRRVVSEVAQDLPPRIDIPTAIDGGARFAQLYESVRQSPNAGTLALLTHLRQVCASPHDRNGYSDLSDFPKYEVALDIMLEAFASDAKVLLFASYIDALDSIARDLSERFPTVFLRVLDGRTSADARQEAIDEFTAHNGAGVLLMNPRATGIGLNIQAASHVIHYTPEWNPAVVAQATARSHRRGQDNPVFVHYLYFADTVEEVMIDRLEAKRQLQDAGLSQNDGEISPSDILEALSRTPMRSSNAS